VIALLRAIDVPARMAAVYASGLSPMDFHAVAEAFIDGSWHVVGRHLTAPRQSLLRISTTGRARQSPSHQPLGQPHAARPRCFAIVDELP
jgi:predicted metal-dependent enzyme (double-stranded beta helix superfamily)